MKKIIFLFALSALFFASCKDKPEVPTAANPMAKRPYRPNIQQPTNEELPVSSHKPTSMEFTEKKHNFGRIKQGDKVMHVFTFKNTGSHDLFIARANGSCGCTVPEFPKEAIAPGKSGSMKVSFNSTGKSGLQHKTVTVYANVPDGVTVIEIEADVQVDKSKK